MVPHSPALRRAGPGRRTKSRRLHEALEEAAGETRETQEAVSAKLGAQYGAIFGAHTLMLSDPALRDEIDGLIRDQSFAAEYAVSRVMRRYAKALESIADGHLAARISDIFDLEKRILSRLLGQRREQLQQLTESVVVLAHDLTPSETAALDPKRVHAFATEAGGRTSHTAIVAGVLEIPAVVGLGPFTTDVSGGDTVIVDGNQGLLIIDPDEEMLAQYERTRRNRRRDEARLNELRDLPAVTREGVRIHLYGNIEFPSECGHCLDRGGEGDRPVPHRIPLPRQEGRPDRGGAPGGVPVGAEGARPQAAAGHPHARPGRRQVPVARRPRPAGTQPVPGACGAFGSVCRIWPCSKRRCVPF